jgi:predicted nuclease with TOPRIM domain
MYDDLNRKLADLTARMEKVFGLEGRLAKLERQRTRLSGRVIRLKRRLSREDDDVERVEHPGFLGFLRFLFGGREKRLRKERHEAYAARQKYDEACERLEPVDDEIAKLRAELEELATLGDEYEAVMTEKEEAIRVQGGANAKRLADLSEGEEWARSAYDLLDECCDEASDASMELARASAALRDAKTMGKIDLGIGGSIYTWGAKHLAVDKAKDLVENAQASLRKLNGLVKDMGGDVKIPAVTMNSLLTVTDLVLSNPIVDLVVIKRIGSSAHRLKKAHRELRRAIRALQKARNEAATELTRLRHEHREFVEKLA